MTNLRAYAIICATAIASIGAAFPLPSTARGIRTDSGNWTLYAAGSQNASGVIQFSGISGISGSANPGIGGATPVWISTTPFTGQADDTGLFTIDSANSQIYSWTTWNAPYTSGDVQCQNPLSNCRGTPIVAQVGIYTLLGNDGMDDAQGNPVDGDTEVVFNYASSCPKSAQLTLFGQTYGFSAPAGAQCGYTGTYASDFLFTQSGVENISSGTNPQPEMGLPPGWTLESTSVPEPSILALFGLGLAVVALNRQLALRRKYAALSEI
jgi:PEP-CTERM motif